MTEKPNETSVLMSSPGGRVFLILFIIIIAIYTLLSIFGVMSMSLTNNFRFSNPLLKFLYLGTSIPAVIIYGAMIALANFITGRTVRIFKTEMTGILSFLGFMILNVIILFAEFDG